MPQNNAIPPAWFPHSDAAFAPFCTPANPQQQQQQYGGYGYDTGGGYGGYDNDSYGGYDTTGAQLQQQQGGEIPTTAPSFNASAKEFVPGSFDPRGANEKILLHLYCVVYNFSFLVYYWNACLSVHVRFENPLSIV